MVSNDWAANVLTALVILSRPADGASFRTYLSKTSDICVHYKHRQKCLTPSKLHDQLWSDGKQQGTSTKISPVRILPTPVTMPIWHPLAIICSFIREATELGKKKTMFSTHYLGLIWPSSSTFPVIGPYKRIMTTLVGWSNILNYISTGNRYVLVKIIYFSEMLCFWKLLISWLVEHASFCVCACVCVANVHASVGIRHWLVIQMVDNENMNVKEA